MRSGNTGELVRTVLTMGLMLNVMFILVASARIKVLRRIYPAVVMLGVVLSVMVGVVYTRINPWAYTEDRFSLSYEHINLIRATLLVLILIAFVVFFHNHPEVELDVRDPAFWTITAIVCLAELIWIGAMIGVSLGAPLQYEHICLSITGKC